MGLICDTQLTSKSDSIHDSNLCGQVCRPSDSRESSRQKDHWTWYSATQNYGYHSI